MEKLQRFNNFKRINESASIDDAKSAIKDVFQKHDGEVTKTYLKKIWEEEKSLRDLYGMDLFYKAWDELIDEEEIKTEDGVKFCWCDMVQESFRNKLNESRKLTEKEIEELGNQDFEEIESDNDLMRRYRLKDGKIIDVNPMGEYFLVDGSEDEPTKKRKLSEREINRLGNQDFEEIESDNDLMRRYRLKDGKIIDVNPMGEYFLVNESVSKEDEKKYLTPKQRKLPEGLKKAIINRAKKSKKKNESVGSFLNENISKEDEEKYLTPKQRKLPEGLKKAIISRAKKSKSKKSEKKNESVEHQKGHSEIADAVRMYLNNKDIEMVCNHDDVENGDPIEILNDALGIKAKYIVELIEDGVVVGDYAIEYICSIG